MPKCLVVLCKNKEKTPGVRFHRISKDRYNAWIEDSGRKRREKLSVHNVVCSLNFSENDYELKGNKRVLKKGAVPTLNLIRRTQGEQKVSVAEGESTESKISNELVGNGDNEVIFVEDKIETCRICLQDTTNKCICKLNNKFFNQDRSVKDMLGSCIPLMDIYLTDEDVICEDCLVELEISYNFMDKCLNTEKKINVSAKNINNSNLTSSVIDSGVQSRNDIIILRDSNDDEAQTADNSNESNSKDYGDSENICKNSADNLVSVEKISTELLRDAENTNQSDNIPSVAELSSATFNESTKIYLFDHLISTMNDSEKILECATKLQAKGINVIHYPSKNLPENLQTNKKIIFLGTCQNSKAKFLECSGCEEAQHDKTQYRMHECMHQKLYRMGFSRYARHCKFCSEDIKEYENVEDLLKHIKSAHKDSKLFKCEDCGKRYSGRDGFRAHRRYNCDPIKNGLKCNPCNLIFEKFSEYRKHTMMHRYYLCEKCGKAFPTQGHLNCHRNVHIDGKNFSCNICDTKFRYDSLLCQHMKRHTDTVKRYLCDKCPKRFNTNNALLHHISSGHLGIKKYVCEICQNRFATIGGMKNHVAIQHHGIKAYQCEICLKYFGRKPCLHRHMRRIHVDNKPGPPRTLSRPPLECKICGKEFKGRYKLKLHLNTHLRIRKFRCEVCGLYFLRNCMLVKHRKTHCVEENKKFRCDLCYKKFATKEEVDLHLPKHKRPKRYQCSQCGELFGRMFLLENHRKVAHETIGFDDINVNDFIQREVRSDK